MCSRSQVSIYDSMVVNAVDEIILTCSADSKGPPVFTAHFFSSEIVSIPYMKPPDVPIMVMLLEVCCGDTMVRNKMARVTQTRHLFMAERKFRCIRTSPFHKEG